MKLKMLIFSTLAFLTGFWSSKVLTEDEKVGNDLIERHLQLEVDSLLEVNKSLTIGNDSLILKVNDLKVIVGKVNTELRLAESRLRATPVEVVEDFVTANDSLLAINVDSTFNANSGLYFRYARYFEPTSIVYLKPYNGFCVTRWVAIDYLVKANVIAEQSKVINYMSKKVNYLTDLNISYSMLVGNLVTIVKNDSLIINDKNVILGLKDDRLKKLRSSNKMLTSSLVATGSVASLKLLNVDNTTAFLAGLSSGVLSYVYLSLRKER